MIGVLEDVLLEARTLCVREDGDFAWSSWRDAEHAAQELDGQLAALRRTCRRPPGLATLFAPTGPMQELAESSGWGDRFLELSVRADHAMARLDLLSLLLDRLTEGGLETALELPADGIGVETARRLGGDVAVTLVPPVDAAELCRAWGLERPVAVSGDAHQRTWTILLAGDEVPDPHGRRITARRVRAGAFTVDAELTGRPRGPLPEVVFGASPAYDVVPGLLVVRVLVRPTRP